MNHSTHKAMNPHAAVALLFTLTIALTIVGITFEVLFISDHLGSLAQELNILASPRLPY